MQPNKTKLALQIGTVILGAACASSVLATTMTMTVNTISDVTVGTVQDLEFGTNILTDELVSCSMGALVPAPADVFSDDTTGAAGTTTGTSGTAFGLLNGAGCIGSGTTIAQPGIYSISGEPTLDVNLTVNNDPAAQDGPYDFSPTGGCGVDHDGSAGTAGTDPCNAITVGAPIVLTLAGGSDSGVAATVFGQTHFTVGGTISVQAGGLSSDTDYVPRFLVSVIY
ncbi:MAG: hypothetical protein ABJK37_23615 [Paraglaciecola sp.]|uniref:hypothetical protein n=1 Tax=Paraglaciecola sp. TaxID=1920173 RepID=UPI003299E4D4